MCTVHVYDVIIFCDSTMFLLSRNIVYDYESLSVLLNMMDILLLNGDYI